MKAFFLIVSVGWCLLLQAQPDRYWHVGDYDRMTIDFAQDTLRVAYPSPVVDILTPLRITEGLSMISDSLGPLVSCDGVKICGRRSLLIPGADTLLSPQVYAWRHLIGLGAFQNTIVLPRNDSTFYVFYLDITDSNVIKNDKAAMPDRLLYSIVAPYARHDTGVILKKGTEALVRDSMRLSGLTACRHANGRDWWLIKPMVHLHDYLVFRVTPDSVYAPVLQSFVNRQFVQPGAFCQLAFSRDGNWLADINWPNAQLCIYQFDRCNGGLQVFKFFDVPDPVPFNDGAGGVGVSFSPSGRFLYVSDINITWQYDLYQPNDTPYVVATVGDSAPCYPGWGQLFLSPPPHNKLFFDNWNITCPYFSYVDSPDQKGPACAFRNHTFPVPFSDAGRMPYQPNYRLGADSTCIYTFTEETARPGPLWRLWPNPTGNYWNYEFTEPASWKLTDSRGEILETGFDRMGILHMENRPPGIYFFTSPYGSVKAVRW